MTYGIVSIIDTLVFICFYYLMQTLYEQTRGLTAEAELADILYHVSQDNLHGVAVQNEFLDPDTFPILNGFKKVSLYAHFSSERTDHADTILVDPGLTVAIGLEADKHTSNKTGLYGHAEVIFEVPPLNPWLEPETSTEVHSYTSIAGEFDEDDALLIDTLNGRTGEAFIQSKDMARALELELAQLLHTFLPQRANDESTEQYLLGLLDTLREIQQRQLDEAAATDAS